LAVRLFSYGSCGGRRLAASGVVRVRRTG